MDYRICNIPCLLLIVMYSACNNPSVIKDKKSDTPDSGKVYVKIDSTKGAEGTDEGKQRTGDSLIVFEYQNDSIYQSLTVKKGFIKSMKYSFLYKKSKSNIVSKIEGLAVKVSNSDGESDIDENGDGYLVDLYRDSDHQVAIRIDIDENRRARFKDFKSESSINEKTNSLGIMHLKK